MRKSYGVVSLLFSVLCSIAPIAASGSAADADDVPERIKKRVKQLSDVLVTTKDSTERQDAIKALDSIRQVEGNEAVMPAIPALAYLAYRWNIDKRTGWREAGQVLALLSKDHASLPWFFQAMSGNDDTVRQRVMRHISGVMRTSPPPETEEVIRAGLLEVVRREDTSDRETNRLHALQIFEEHFDQDDAMVDAIVAAVQSAKTGELKLKGPSALVRRDRDRRGVHAALKLAGHKDDTTRYGALQALGGFIAPKGIRAQLKPGSEDEKLAQELFEIVKDGSKHPDPSSPWRNPVMRRGAMTSAE